MPTVQLENARWKPYLDRVANTLRGQQAYVEVSGLGLGDQVESEWLPLLGIAYDPKSDVVEMATEAVDHLISHPNRIYVQYESDGLHNLEVVDADGNQHIMRLREPLKLPQG